MDLSAKLTGKSYRIGLGFNVNQRYFYTIVIREKISVPDRIVDSITLKLLYLSGVSTAVVHVGVFSPKS